MFAMLHVPNRPAASLSMVPSQAGHRGAVLRVVGMDAER